MEVSLLNSTTSNPDIESRLPVGFLMRTRFLTNPTDQSAVERLQRLEQQGALKRESALAALEEARAQKEEAEAEHKEMLAKLTERQAQVRGFEGRRINGILRWRFNFQRIGEAKREWNSQMVCRIAEERRGEDPACR
jgi:hypothetical protein